MSASAPSPAITTSDAGLRLRVRLTPRARRDALGGFETLADGNQVMTAHVRALPADGAANTALVALLAESLGVARSKVTIASGHGSRVKTLAVAGDGTTLATTLRRLGETAK